MPPPTPASQQATLLTRFLADRSRTQRSIFATETLFKFKPRMDFHVDVRVNKTNCSLTHFNVQFYNKCFVEIQLGSFRLLHATN